MEIRPRIAILGRFAESTSVTRYAGVVNARRRMRLVINTPKARQCDGAVGREDAAVVLRGRQQPLG